MDEAASSLKVVMKNFMKGLGLFSLMLSLVSATFTSQEKWSTPCGGPPVSGFPIGSTDALLENLLAMHDEGVMIAAELKEIYKSERVKNSRFIPMLDDFTFEGMPKVTMTDDELEDCPLNVTRTYQSNYEKLSTVLVFMEQVIYDEEHWEQKNDVLTAQFSNIMIKCLNILCNEQKLILNSGYEIDYVSPDVMDDNYRKTTSSYNRHLRDYVIIKDMAVLLGTLEKVVELIKNKS